MPSKICAECNGHFFEKSVDCGYCDKSVHKRCSKLSKDVNDLLENNQNIFWKCPSCAKFNGPDGSSHSSIRQTNTTKTSTALLQRLSTNGTILIVLIVIIIVSVGVAVYLALRKEDTKPREILFGNDYDFGHLVMDRSQWGATDHYNLSRKLEHPIPYVLITHVGVQSVPCENIYKCSIKMRTFQDSAIVEHGLPDIDSNFYVGNDGNIYVGRGWDYANTYGNKSLAITFIGDFDRYKPTNKSLEAVEYLLTQAISNKLLALDYKLIAQNQTKTTKSPGINVIREIKKWPHWYPCGEAENPICGVEIGLPEIWNARQ